MSEQSTTTPDNILKSRAISDGELLQDGAEYENGILKGSPEQLESLRLRYARELGGTGLEATMLYGENIADLAYMPTDTSIENEAALSARISDITVNYEDALHSGFPKTLGLLKKQATATHETSKISYGREVDYSMQFHSTLENENGIKKVKPTAVEVAVDQYGKGHKYYEVRTFRPSKETLDARDEAVYAYDEDEKIRHIALSTRILRGSDVDILAEVETKTVGPFNKGIVPDVLGVVDANALPETQIYSDKRYDLGYSTEIDLTPGNYVVEFSRDVMGPQPPGYWSMYQGKEQVAYKFNPEKNCFVKSEATGEWNFGPEELETSQFIDIVEKALGNIPTVGGEPLVSR